jgi:hypothetical protein
MVKNSGKQNMLDSLTRRQAIVAAALAADDAPQFAPVQVQKLFFLVDENLADHLEGKLFAFQPYNYGPFDAEVYRELESLRARGLASIVEGAGAGRRRYRLTPAGYAVGKKELDRLPSAAGSYITAASKWVRSMSFPALVGSIYKAYPRMRANSIFEG